MMNFDDQDTQSSICRLRLMVDEYLRRESPAERDRRLQRYLAQARGPQLNMLLLRQVTDRLMQSRQAQEEHHDE